MSQQESYSNSLIKFVLTHYIDILYGKITPEEMGDFCRSMGRKNPLETALIWKSDIDEAIISLSKSHHGWGDALRDAKEIEVGGVKVRKMSDAMILHLCRSNSVSGWQRMLINHCILRDCGKDCKVTGSRGSKICWNEGIITRMRKYLNGRRLWVKDQPRGADGRFEAMVDRVLAALTVGEAKTPSPLDKMNV